VAATMTHRWRCCATAADVRNELAFKFNRE